MYIFGDQCLAPQLPRDALVHLHRYFTDRNNSDLSDPDHISCASGNLAAYSPMCRYLVDAMINRSDNQTDGGGCYSIKEQNK